MKRTIALILAVAMALSDGKNYAAVLCFYGMDTLAAHEILYKLNV